MSTKISVKLFITIALGASIFYLGSKVFSMTDYDFHCDHFSKSGDTICYSNTDAKVIAQSEGYSGQPAFRNNPDFDSIRELGSIPAGEYNIVGVAQILNNNAHSNVIVLEPLSTTDTAGRGNFRIHGDYRDYRIGTASHGCIIANPIFRKTLADKINANQKGILKVYPTYPRTIPIEK